MSERISPACALAVRDKTLSAWRDETLPQRERATLGIHIATCSACQRRLAAYEGVAYALRRQRELEPGNRVWDAVRLRTQHRRRRTPGMTSTQLRRGLGSLVAVASVILIVALFVTLTNMRPGGSTGKATPTASGTATAMATPGTTPSPTSTSAPSPTVPPTGKVLDVARSWGPNAALTSFSTRLDATHTFVADGISPDGHYLLGDEYTPTTVNAPNGTAEAGYLDISTRQFMPIGLSAGANAAPSCCQADGRFIVAQDSSQPGATCGACHARVWAYDMTTRQLRLVATGGPLQGIEQVILSHGLLVIGTNGDGIQVADLAAKTITPLAHSPAVAAPVAFVWPYLIYNPAQANPSLIARDMTTNAQVTLPASVLAPNDPSVTNQGFALTGDTFFTGWANASASGLLELDHVMSASAAPRVLPSAPVGGEGVSSANGRLVALGPLPLVWDRAEEHYVSFGASTAASQNGGVYVVIAGHYLLVAISTAATPTPANPQQVTIYDTNQLPVLR